ncbi:MAG: helix-turn-helix transcriptional regulator [Treponema sp.]|jgi:putative molybdopterin biosynthesis protein|nr:helix-turn-helix transcriptional regulator [Treponema sp.]
MESTLLTAEDVARQLRIKKYTVYELIKRGELPSSRVGKQVRVSQEDIDRYLRAGRTGPFFAGEEHRENRTDRKGESSKDKPAAGIPDSAPALLREVQDKPLSTTPLRTVPFREPAEDPLILCGQDICLDLLVSRLSALGFGPALRSYTGCYNGLIALYNGKVTMAASHLWDSQTNTYNHSFIRCLLPGLPVGVFRLVGRIQGFYVQKGNPLKIQGWQDLARPGITMINRERGCGTRILLDQKLRLLKIDTRNIQGYTRESTSHMACAGIVARGGADIGCGCERGAEHIAGADFIPLQPEWYDLVFRLGDQDKPALKALISYITEDEFKQDLALIGGYDLSQTGNYTEF